MGISIISCKKDNINILPNTDSVSQKIVKSEGMTILGKQLKNPYTVANMQEAFELISDKNVELSKTDLYVRFLPDNVNQIKELEDLGLELLELPVDYEVLEYGSYYHDPTIPNDKFTWFYVVIKPDFIFPNIKHEILDELFLPFNIENTNQSKIGTLVNIRDLETKALEITGNLPERQKNQDRVTNYFPDGYIEVQNNIVPNNYTPITPLPITIPVKNLRVRAQYWFHFDNTFTDNMGHFHIDDSFWFSSTIKVFFENEHVKIRAIRGLNLSPIPFVLKQEIGEYSGSDMENINHVFPNSLDNETEEKALWMGSNTINSMAEYDQMCIQAGLPRPLKDLNIWLTTKITEDASAPMLHKISSTGLIALFAPIYLIPTNSILFPTMLPILSTYPPDITFDYNPSIKSSLTTDLIANTFYHEFVHSNHYAQVGNIYWSAYINYIVLHLGYGYQNSFDSGRVEVSETWAETVGDIFTDMAFNVNSLQNNDRYTKNMELESPTGGLDWFRDGIMYDMYDDVMSNEFILYGYIDNVNTYSLIQMYGALDASVISLSDFKTKVLFLTNNQQQLEVNELFTSYGI